MPRGGGTRRSQPQHEPTPAAPARARGGDDGLELPGGAGLPDGVMAAVEVQPGQVGITFTQVPAESAGLVAMYGVVLMQALRRRFPELEPVLPEVGGGQPVDVPHDGAADSDRAPARRPHALGF